MKAALLKEVGDDQLEIRDDLSTVDPGPNEVRIRVRASGICHSDLSAMSGTLPAMAPGILGHEGAGEVLEVGSAVTDLAVGDHVITVLVPPCGACSSCLRGQPHLCSVHAIESFSSPRFKLGDQDVFGFTGCGTFAEELVVPRAGAVKIDSEVPFEIAALVGCGVLTGVGAVVNTAQVEPGATVAVIGCGGVGVSVIQGARLAGASIIVGVDPIAEKQELAKRFGATHAATPDDLAELIESITGGEGVDYAFEVVGLPTTIRSAFDTARRGGTAVVVGAGAADAQVEFSAQELFVMERRLLGSFYGSGDVRWEYHRLLGLWRAGRLDLEGMISSRIPLAHINDALQKLRKGANVIRQVIIYD